MIQRFATFGSNQLLQKKATPFITSVDENNESLLIERESENEFELVDVSSGLVESTLLSFFPDGKYDAISHSRRIALLYSTSIGGSSFSIYDLNLGNHIYVGQLPLKSNQRIISVAASPCRDGIFFVGVSGESVVHTIFLNTESGHAIIFDEYDNALFESS